MATKYTVTIQNDVHPGPSFCRFTEKIAPLKRYQFSFTTSDNTTRGLIAHYPFNNNVLDHSNVDLSWNDGSISSVTSDTGKDDESNGSYRFVGSTSSNIKINHHSNLSFTDNFTISMWIYPDGISQSNLIQKDGEYKISIDNTGYFNSTLNLSDLNLQASSCKIDDKEWGHLVFTYEKGNGGKIYWNNKFCDQKNFSGPLLGNTTNDLYIGTNFKGLIDEVKIFNILLETGEIRELYVDTGRKLGGYYPLGMHQGNDFSGKGNDGTVRSSPTLVQNYRNITNRATNFDGIDDFIEVPFNSNLNGEKFTVIFWIKPSNQNRTMEGIVSLEDYKKGFGLYKWYYAYSTLKTNNGTAPNTSLYNNRKTLTTINSNQCKQHTTPYETQ